MWKSTHALSKIYIWDLYQKRGGRVPFSFRVGIAWIELKPEDQNLMEFFLRPEQSPRYSTKEASGGHNDNKLIFSWHPSYPRTIWFCSRQHHYHHHIIYIAFLLVSIISTHHHHDFFLIKLLSPSGDLGISLVWHNLSGPHPTTPPRLFGLSVEILFKVN